MGLAMLTATVWLIFSVAWPADGAVGWWNCTEHFVNGIPPSQLNNTISLCRGGYYALSWDPPMENPSWAAYRISKENTSMKIAGRVNGFRKDPDLQDLGVPNPSTSDDAYNALWNRGHVAPSAILSATYLSKYSTYYTSNIAPQWWQFNQRSWGSLESRVFKFIDTTNRTLHIVSGIGYANRSTAVKVGDVALPTWYWKALCDVEAKTSVAFIGNNSQDGGGMMWTYRSVQDVQDTVFCGTQNSPGLNDTAINAAGGKGGFSIFPVDICNTQTYNSSHWNFDGYMDHNLQGANCSVPFQRPESNSAASSAVFSSPESVASAEEALGSSSTTSTGSSSGSKFSSRNSGVVGPITNSPQNNNGNGNAPADGGASNSSFFIGLGVLVGVLIALAIAGALVFRFCTKRSARAALHEQAQGFRGRSVTQAINHGGDPEKPLPNVMSVGDNLLDLDEPTEMDPSKDDDL